MLSACMTCWGMYLSGCGIGPWEYSGGSLTDPSGPAEGRTRGMRGCSWIDFTRMCRSSNRMALWSSHRSSTHGFRLLRTD